MKTTFGVAACLTLAGIVGCSSSDSARKTQERDGGGVDAAIGSGGSHGGTGGSTGTGGATSNPKPGADAGADAADDRGDAATDAGSDATVSSEGGTPVGDGGSFTPESILAVPEVQAALAGAADAGYPIATHTEKDPPAISGYYVKPAGEGSYVATSNGDGVGNGVLGTEYRITVDANDHVEEASVAYSQGATFVWELSKGAILRGANGEFTLYQTHHVDCVYGNSDFGVDGYQITSAHLYGPDNYWLQVRELTVTVSTHGTLDSTCAQAFIGDSENPGGWSVNEVPRYQTITTADLQYMCVDGDKGYIPEETWKVSGGDCMCTPDVTTECF